MGRNVYVYGVYGLLLSEFPALTPLAQQMQKSVEDMTKEEENHHSGSQLVREPEFQRKWLSKVRTAFSKGGIVLPVGVVLRWTGSWDECPYPCETEFEQFVAGYLLETSPGAWGRKYKLSTWDASFSGKARWHFWAEVT